MSTAKPQNRRHPLSSLATKIILFVFASTFATAIGVSWASIQSTHDSLRTMLDHLYPTTLEQAARQLRPSLDGATAELEAVAADPAVRDLRSRETTRRLTALLEQAPHWRGAARVDAKGQRVAEAGKLPDQLERLTSRVDLEDGTRHPVVWMPVPGSGAVVGILEGGSIAAVLAEMLPSDAETIALVDANGDVLSVVGARADVLRDQKLPRPRDREGRTSEYESAGQPVIGAALPLGRDGWELVIETPFHLAFAPVLDSVSRIFVIDLVVILLFSFLAYRVTGAVVQPIEQLSDWARRIAQGQTDLEFPDTGGRDELGLLARTFNDMMRQLRRKQEEIETANRSLLDRNVRLQQANEVLNQLSITDGLTKLHNHRYFQDHLTREIKRVSRTKESLAMLLIDIDDFKQLNDRFGHAAGDEMLKRIAPLLNQAVRETDLVARYGGEEFVILALNTDAAGAYPLAEKVRTSIAESSFILDDSLRPLRITVSIGVATYRGNRKRFFQRADEALYRAKAQGKNCVILDEEDAEAFEENA